MGRPSPRFWWDFVHQDGDISGVIVQSDYEGGECLATFKPDEIPEAEKLISDFKAGRKTPKWGKNNGKSHRIQ